MARSWEQYKFKILSFIIAVYSLPLHFSRPLPYSYDGGWMTSLNLAIKNHLVFGKDFIFTYGPLGLLSTRCNLYSNNLLFLAGDLFFATGCFYFIYKYVLQSKGWFLIAFLTMLIFRTTAFSQSMFVVFIIYAALNLRNNFSNYFELGYCAIAGALLFFVKINYGILVIAAFAVFAGILAFKDHRKLLFLLLVSGGLFTAICFTMHIAVIDYLKYSIAMAGQYDEVGYWPIKRGEMVYVSGISLLLLIACVVGYYSYCQWKNKALTYSILFFLCCISAASFVLYRNAFTRADFYHYGEFFATLPFWALAIVVLCRMQQHMFSKVMVIVFALVSWYNLILPDIADDTFIPKLKADNYFSYYSPLEYVNTALGNRNPSLLQPQLSSAANAPDLRLCRGLRLTERRFLFRFRSAGGCNDPEFPHRL